MKDKIEQINTQMAKKHDLIDSDEVSYGKVRDAIRHPENFTGRIESSDIEISPGVRLSSRTIETGYGHFSNMYDIYFNNKNKELSTQIITRQKPLYPHRLFTNERNKPSSTAPVACINGVFFFLQDGQLENVPKDIIYNLNINNGKVVGLPAVDRAALFVTKDGRIHATELEASGLITIGTKEVRWVGGEPIAHQRLSGKFDNNIDKAVLFNSACCTIEYENSADKTSLRRLRQDLNHTPKGESVTDIIVNADGKGELHVSTIKQGGGTDFFSGNFILQMQNKDSIGIKIGDRVDPKTVGTLNLNEIQSSVTTGPMVNHFQNHNDHEINHDLSLGSFPPFAEKTRYARSVIYEDKNDNIHMVVFDAVPLSKSMKGVTPQETAQNIPTDAKWAVFLDGGQSSRLTFELTEPNTKNELFDARGNLQYVRLHKRDKTSQTAEGEGQFLWTTRGRPLSSMIALYRNKP